jgi:hypothetical protein
MSTSQTTKCNGCDKAIAPGARYLNVYLTEQVARVDDESRFSRRKRIIRETELREDVEADFCGDCLAKPRALGELLEALAGPVKALEIGRRVRATRAESESFVGATGRLVELVDDDAIVELDAPVSFGAALLEAGERVRFKTFVLDHADDDKGRR